MTRGSGTPRPKAQGCPAHRALVSAVVDGDPDDALLDRYADEVPSCEACQRELAVQLGVHPARIHRPASQLDDLEGMGALGAALWPETADTPRRSYRLWLAGCAVAVAAAAAAAVLLSVSAERSPPEAPIVVDVVRPSPLPSPAPAPALAEPVQPIVAAAPVEQPQTRRVPVPPPAPPSDALDDWAIADALDDWPPPPFEDLRIGAPKSVVSSVRAIQLVLVGQPGYVVGEGVDLVVVASHDAPITVCVEGPERGTVWRGAVPAGRTALTQRGIQQAFAFTAPGTYRFSLSAGGAERCGEPLHVVEVEVTP